MSPTSGRDNEPARAPRYEEFVADISRVIPVIKVAWEAFQDTSAVASAVREEYLKLSAIHRVDFATAGVRVANSPRASAAKT